MCRPEVWQDLGQQDTLVWGAFCGLKVSYHTSFDRVSKTYACSCKSPRYPCNHGAGLWMLHQREAHLFTGTVLPAWLDHAKRHPKFSTTSFFTQTPANPVQWEQNAQQRLAYIQLGLADLEAWLLDLIDNGLATAPDKPKGYWMDMSRRLNDSYCPTIATQIEQFPKVIANNANWPAHLLATLSKLYLLTQAFKNFDSHTPATQFDLFTTVGWHNSALPAETDTAIQDTWVVLDRQLSLVRKRQTVTVTLWGQTSQRFAQLTGVAHNRQTPDIHLMPGVTLDAMLRFYPSEVGLSAYPETLTIQTTATAHPMPSDFGSIIQNFQATVLAHPWVTEQPVLLSKVAVTVHNGAFYIQDGMRQALPLSKSSKANWYLHIYSRQAPVSVFGYWNGTDFDAKTLNFEGRWLPLAALAEIKS